MKAQTIWRPSRISLSVWLLLALSATAFANPKEEYKLVSYCELMNHPKDYNGVNIEVQAAYTAGFEWSLLTSSDCLIRTSVEFPPWKDEMDRASRTESSKIKAMRWHRVTFRGKFISGRSDGYGHTKLPHQLNVTGIREVQILDKRIVSPEKLTDEQRRNFPSGHVISSRSAF